MNEPKLMCVKRTTIYGILLLMALTMQAQTSAKVKERVAEIRKLYADAKENMAYNDQDEYPAKTNMEVTYYYMAPGAGPIPITPAGGALTTAPNRKVKVTGPTQLLR